MFAIPIIGFLSTLLTFAVTYAPVAAVVVGAMAIVQSRSQAKKAKSESKKQRIQASQSLASQDYYAGQYLDLTERQMEIQGKQRAIDTLANVIEDSEQAPRQIVTLPPAKSYSALEQINLSIDKFVKG